MSGDILTGDGPDMLDGKPDTVPTNHSLPSFPDALPLWRRVVCLLGYHSFREWRTGPRHKFPGMRLRDKCVHCGSLQ